MVEILKVLFEECYGLYKQPQSDLVISQGWASLPVYYFLMKYGKISRQHFAQYLDFDSICPGCLESLTPGVLTSTGSCGHGLPFSCGLALGRKWLQRDGFVFCTLGDGELGEGSIWESLMSASRKNLTNLILVIDRNHGQSGGKTEDITALEPLSRKLESFGFSVLKVDGHDEELIRQAITSFKEDSSKGPKVLIAETLMGKGVTSLETHPNCHWIGSVDDETYIRWLKELT